MSNLGSILQTTGRNLFKNRKVVILIFSANLLTHYIEKQHLDIPDIIDENKLRSVFHGKGAEQLSTLQFSADKDGALILKTESIENGIKIFPSKTADIFIRVPKLSPGKTFIRYSIESSNGDLSFLSNNNEKEYESEPIRLPNNIQSYQLIDNFCMIKIVSCAHRPVILKELELYQQ